MLFRSSKTTLQKEEFSRGAARDWKRAHLPTAWPSTLKSKKTRGFTIVLGGEELEEGRASSGETRTSFGGLLLLLFSAPCSQDFSRMGANGSTDSGAGYSAGGGGGGSRARAAPAGPEDHYEGASCPSSPSNLSNAVRNVVLGIVIQATADEIKKACVPHELSSSSPADFLSLLRSAGSARPRCCTTLTRTRTISKALRSGLRGSSRRTR